MGLDITLGVVIFIAAIRGWFKGFVRQAIPLAAMVGCVYAADPLRELARPRARAYFPSIGPDVLDRLLWWTAAALSYLLMTGVALSIVRAMKRRTYGEPEPNRADQGAGFTLGAAKGLIVASCIAAAISSYAPPYFPSAPFAEEQTKSSRAMEWARKYRPAETLWQSPPVQAFVARVKSRGVWSGETKARPSEEHKPGKLEVETAQPSPPSEPPIRTAAGRPKTLQMRRHLDPSSPDFLREFEDEMSREGLATDRP